MTVPADRQYTAEHEWLLDEGEVTRVGITAYAADALGDIVYAELPQVGDAVTAGSPCGEIESTKSVSEIFSPATGTVVAVNDAVVDSPETVNADPYGDGWLFTLDVQQPGEVLDAQEYAALIAQEGA